MMPASLMVAALSVVFVDVALQAGGAGVGAAAVVERTVVRMIERIADENMLKLAVVVVEEEEEKFRSDECCSRYRCLS